MIETKTTKINLSSSTSKDSLISGPKIYTLKMTRMMEKMKMKINDRKREPI